MKIEDIVNLTQGILQTTPQVHSVEGVTVFPSKVDRGDLFFSNKSEDIDSAIASGAHAVVYEKASGVEITDREIAWIEVDSLKESAFRLLRYVLLTKEADFALFEAHEMSYLKQVLTHKGNITVLYDRWDKAFEQILNGGGNLFVGSDDQIMKLIKPESVRLTETADGYLVDDTLFKSTFRVEKYIYQEKKVPPFYLDYILKVVSFCEKHELPYSLDKLNYTKHFTPIFIDNKLSRATQSASDKVLIFVDNLEDIVKSRDYVRYQSTWVKSIVLTPPKTKVPNVERPHWFESVEEAIEILKGVHFNYAFIYTQDTQLSSQLVKEESVTTLF